MSMTIATPAGPDVSLSRFLVLATGAGLGVWTYSNFIYARLPDALTEWEIFGQFGGNEILWGVFALLGATAANALYSSIGK
jgi:hypothetical protein